MLISCGKAPVNSVWHLTNRRWNSQVDRSPLCRLQINSSWISQTWPLIAGCQEGGGAAAAAAARSLGCWYMKWLGECGMFPLSCPLHCNYHCCSFCTSAPISPRHCNRDWLVRRPKQRRLKKAAHTHLITALPFDLLLLLLLLTHCFSLHPCAFPCSRVGGVDKNALVDERRLDAADACYWACSYSAWLNIITVYVRPMRELINTWIRCELLRWLDASLT